MKQLYSTEDIEVLKRKYKGEKVFAAVFGGAIFVSFIIICLLTNTANAKFNENLASAIVIIGGIVLIYLALNVVRYTSAEIKHAEMLADEDREVLEGTFEMAPDSYKISGSIEIRHISLQTDEGKRRLNVIEEKAPQLSNITGRVRFETVNNYVSAFEECGAGEACVSAGEATGNGGAV